MNITNTVEVTNANEFKKKYGVKKVPFIVDLPGFGILESKKRGPVWCAFLDVLLNGEFDAVLVKRGYSDKIIQSYRRGVQEVAFY